MCLLPAGLPSLHCLIQEGLGSVEVVEEGRGTGSGVKIAQVVKRKKGDKGANLWQVGILASHCCGGSGRHQEALKDPKMPRRSKGTRNNRHASTDLEHKVI